MTFIYLFILAGYLEEWCARHGEHLSHYMLCQSLGKKIVSMLTLDVCIRTQHFIAL